MHKQNRRKRTKTNSKAMRRETMQSYDSATKAKNARNACQRSTTSLRRVDMSADIFSAMVSCKRQQRKKWMQRNHDVFENDYTTNIWVDNFKNCTTFPRPIFCGPLPRITARTPRLRQGASFLIAPLKLFTGVRL